MSESRSTPKRLVSYGARVEPSLLAALAGERARGSEPDAAEQAMLAAVGASLAKELGPALHGGESPVPARSWRLPLGLVGASAVVALGALLVTSAPSLGGTARPALNAPAREMATAPVFAAASSTKAPAAGGSAPEEPAVSVSALPRAPAVGRAMEAVPAEAAPTAPAPVAAPDGELALVAAAQRALREDPRRALELADQHARAYASGAFAEEREAIAVEALALRGDLEAARARWSSFETRFPRSSHRVRLAPMLAPR